MRGIPRIVSKVVQPLYAQLTYCAERPIFQWGKSSAQDPPRTGFFTSTNDLLTKLSQVIGPMPTEPPVKFSKPYRSNQCLTYVAESKSEPEILCGILKMRADMDA